MLLAVLTGTSCSSGNEPSDPKQDEYPVFKYEDITLTVTNIYYDGKGDEKVTVHYDLQKKTMGRMAASLYHIYTIKAKDGTVFREETQVASFDAFENKNIVSNWDLISVSVAKEIDISTLNVEFKWGYPYP